MYLGLVVVVSCRSDQFTIRGSTGSCGVCLVLGKEMLTKLTRSHSGSETVKYHWKLLQVALGMYMQVTRVQRVGAPQTS